jgi:hypothetical protein
VAVKGFEIVDKASVLAAVCQAVSVGTPDHAAAILERDYPFAPEMVTKRRFRPTEYLQVFIRDGFIDRYTGDRLIFPPVLRAVSFALQEHFPYHPNWKTQVTHPAYWEVSATIDHLIPVTCGGADEASNWVTTSMARNSAKMNWTLAELGWQLHPPGDVREWDGMLQWFVQYADMRPEIIADNGMRSWLQAGKLALSSST